MKNDSEKSEKESFPNFCGFFEKWYKTENSWPADG